MFRSKGGTKVNIPRLINYLNKNKYKVSNIKVKDFKKVLDIPVWEDGTLTPRELTQNPNAYKDHYKRYLDAELKYPIIIHNGVIVDGYHRLTKAVVEKRKTLPAYIIDDKIYNMFPIR